MRVALCVLFLCACGPTTKRNVRDPAPQMTFDDECRLQDYFDERRTNMLAPPKAQDEVIATNEKGLTTGEGTYKLHDAVARKRFARLLREEYSGVDPKVIKAVESSEGDVLVRVRWWDSGKVKRLRVEDDIHLTTSVGSIELPPNMCVSDLLFGDQIYEMRARYLRNEVDMATGKSTAPSIPSADPTPTPAPAPSASAPPLPAASP